MMAEITELHACCSALRRSAHHRASRTRRVGQRTARDLLPGGQGPCERAERRPCGGGAPMRAVTWHGRADGRVDTVPDPTIQDPTDVIVQITSSGICGSDLHLIEVM